MTQYINKSILIEEIKKRISLFKKEKKTEKWSAGASQMNVVSLGARIAMLEEILSFLDTLEVKEEIFDESEKKKLMQKCVHEAYKRGYDMGVLQATNKINHNTKEVDLEQEIQQHINNCLDIKFPTTDIKMIATNNKIDRNFLIFSPPFL
jgi:hypothetical protein